MGWQWHELDHMQIICSSLQTDNHVNTSSLNFLQARRSSNRVKALKPKPQKISHCLILSSHINSWWKQCHTTEPFMAVFCVQQDTWILCGSYLLLLKGQDTRLTLRGRHLEWIISLLQQRVTVLHIPETDNHANSRRLTTINLYALCHMISGALTVMWPRPPRQGCERQNCTRETNHNYYEKISFISSK